MLEESMRFDLSLFFDSQKVFYLLQNRTECRPTIWTSHSQFHHNLYLLHLPLLSAFLIFIVIYLNGFFVLLILHLVYSLSSQRRCAVAMPLSYWCLGLATILRWQCRSVAMQSLCWSHFFHLQCFRFLFLLLFLALAFFWRFPFISTFSYVILGALILVSVPVLLLMFSFW